MFTSNFIINERKRMKHKYHFFINDIKNKLNIRKINKICAKIENIVYKINLIYELRFNFLLTFI